MCFFLPCVAFVWLVAGSAFSLGWLLRRPPAQPRKTSYAAPTPKPPKTPKPATPLICPHCRHRHAVSPSGLLALLSRPTPPPWSTRRGRGGPKKTRDSGGRYCTNPACAYFAISDPAIQALVADGQRRGVQIWQCQVCQRHVCDTFGTFLYGRKKAPEIIQAVLSDLCHGQSVRQTAREHGVNKNTVVAWLIQCGQRAPLVWKLLAEGKLQPATIQLDELKTFVRKKDAHLSAAEKALGEVGSQWGWTAIDPVSKLWLVALVGPRTKEMACHVVHSLCSLLAPGCVPAFSPDGLIHYFYALTAHCGQWVADVRGKECWQVSSLLQYGQVIKHYRRKRLSHIVRHMLLGTLDQLRQILSAAGTRPSLNTSFVERLNLTLRCGLAALTRRTPCIAKSKRTLQYRLNLFLLYYNLIRVHSTIETTPAHEAGLTDQVWQWEELLNVRLPPERQFRLVC
jgi:transposase-like protein